MITELEMHGEFDALKWTKFWEQTIHEHPEIPKDPDTMVGWFANVLMAGYDKGYAAGVNEARRELAEHGTLKGTV